MSPVGQWRRRGLLAAGVALALSPTASAQAPTQPPEPRRLPPDVTTRHAVDLPDRSLRFSASAGGIRLFDARNAPLVDLAFVSYQLDGVERTRRPVTFVFNGGPGFSSAWLQVGAVGPWRIPIGGNATVPSASPEPLPNADTWLDFTDLVFIDPAGTGYSRVLNGGDETRRQLFSVDGDVRYLAEAIRRWLDKFDRGVSPKFILGESYGGFRGPRLVHELAASEGTGVSGLVLASPALDFGGRSSAFDPLSYVTRLPSMAAAARATHGPVSRDQVADVEQYAATQYLLDLTRGERDRDAITRRSARVAEFTGLDPALVRRHHGMIDNDVFVRELDRVEDRVGSIYDATITSLNPLPLEESDHLADPVLDALKAPVSSAMVAIYNSQLNWRPELSYRLFDGAANRQWNWGNGFGARPEAVGPMRGALALDPHFAVLIAHGLFDLVTPYFATQLLIDQIPLASGGDRLHLEVYPGGHMFYANDASRAAWRNASRTLIETR